MNDYNDEIDWVREKRWQDGVRYQESPVGRADGLKPYSYSAIAADPYHAQYFIMREIGMDEFTRPDYFRDSDTAQRLGGDAFENLCRWAYGTRGHLGIGHWAMTASAKRVLAFGNRMYEIVEGIEGRVFDGIRVVRMTNNGTGQPLFSIQMKEKR